MLVSRTMHILVDLPAFCARRRKMDKSATLKGFKRYLHKAGRVHSLLELFPGYGRYGRVIAAIWPDNPPDRRKGARFPGTCRSEMKGNPNHIGSPIKKKKGSRGGRSGEKVEATSVALANTPQGFNPMALGLSEEMARLILEERIDYMDWSMDI
ncbi:hypothetical protein TWF106_003339 [Orbilia oligospora]|uniref:Uncharacterized protein n=1 Tax=Orbilia oligospora TaxID=2813651 RepID=A0A6G1MAY1_ORBOL|nr:hypothetical protein TWF679_000976 [Orbilia oligospora]KAF3224320.1 hypothetical protein TWF191_006102 [Orbilia oligospora]KAF3224896.1 hypothetical protein TWF106_003339 [Orbilia oligospora]KAF3249548.1 hypothetical protein TWF192_005622 [Orbilia oligospora]